MQNKRERLAGPHLDAVADGHDAFFLGAVGAAIDGAASLNAVAYNFAAAVLTHRSKRVDCAFEGIEPVRLPIHDDLECSIVIVPANLTNLHTYLRWDRTRDGRECN